MNSFWTKTALAAVALVCVGAASAGTIDFENLDTTGAPLAPYFLLDQDYVTQGNYFISVYDAANPTPNVPDGAFVGALMNGSDPTTCLDNACSHGNSTNYIAAVNDGIVYIDGGGAKLSLVSFDASFLSPDDVALPSTTVAYLGVEADRSDGTFGFGLYALNGPTNGATTFQTFLATNALPGGGTGTLSSGNVVDLQFYEYFCDSATGNCNFGTTDRGQFALDNVVFSVPEPSSWLLMALGLGALGIAARRRQSI